MEGGAVKQEAEVLEVGGEAGVRSRSGFGALAGGGCGVGQEAAQERVLPGPSKGG